MSNDQRLQIFYAITALKLELVSVADQMTFNGSAIASGAGSTSTFKVGSGTASSDTFAVTSKVISAAASVAVISTSATLDPIDITYVQDLIDTTLNRLSNTGSPVERLKHKEDIIRSQIETNEAVRSNYEDVDFAKEHMELMKVQIL